MALHMYVRRTHIGTKIKSQAAGKMGYTTSEVGDLAVGAL
jgi:hypothetical protein